MLERLEAPPIDPLAKQERYRGLIGFTRYLTRRFLTVAFMVICAVYITIIVANLGGYVDVIVRGRIQMSAGFMAMGGAFEDLPIEERERAFDELVASMEKQAGLDIPFPIRTLRWVVDGLTFNWGSPANRQLGRVRGEPVTVRELIAQNLSRSLLIFGTANLLLFVTSIAVGLLLIRVRNRWIDKLLVLLSSLSSAPAWVYGVLLTVFLLRVFGFSAGGTLRQLPDELSWAAIRSLLRVLLLPLLAILLSGLFQGIYTWRSFFLAFSDEEYVTMGRAKGLSEAALERNYIIRPALPALLTSVALLMMTIWQEIIALEWFFNVEGIGRLLVTAVNQFDTPIIVGLVVLFAYLLGITVFMLDIAYALVDPRIRVAGNGSVRSKARVQRRLRLRLPRLQQVGQSWRETVRELGGGFGRLWSELKRYPSALFGIAFITLLIIISIVTVIKIPYSVATEQWLIQDDRYIRNPRAALPAWTNLFRKDDLFPSLTLHSSDANVQRQRQSLSATSEELTLTYPISFLYSTFPQELIIDFEPTYQEKPPFAELALITPDNRTIDLTTLTINGDNLAYYLGRDDNLKRRIDSELPQQTLFAVPDAAGEPTVLPGDYALQMTFVFFEPDNDVDATVSLVGQVHGIAGTDVAGRDMSIALLWGTPVALAFGLCAALITTLFAMIAAALSAWYGGWIDGVIQFFTEVNLILPFYPMALLIFILYSKSILAILAVTVALNLFNDSIKVYRAAFLQLKESPFVEAAQAYGASGWRIAIHYMTPRIVGLILPRLVIIVPTYVFLEATLAFLGVSDPRLPTWGKLIVAAMSGGIYNKSAHLVLVPLGIVFLTSLAFGLVAHALEDIYRPD